VVLTFQNFLWIAAFGILIFYEDFANLVEKNFSAAIDYNRFHLSAIKRIKALIKNLNMRCTSMGNNKQLPDDLKKEGDLA
jgi:hypothetical protein